MCKVFREVSLLSNSHVLVTRLQCMCVCMHTHVHVYVKTGLRLGYQLVAVCDDVSVW